jgi:hypothetical protein
MCSSDQIFFTDDANLVAIGFDHNPTMYTFLMLSANSWALAGPLLL